MQNILVISRDKDITDIFEESCAEECRLVFVSSVDEGIDSLKSKRSELVFLDMDILSDAARSSGYKAVLQSFWLIAPSLEIVIMTSRKMLREAVQAVKLGAGDYITYPILADEIRLVAASLHQSQKVQSELDYLRDQFWDQESLDVVRTKCPAMKKVFADVRSVSPTRSTVLLTGETGTGKGVLAKVIHKHSNRKNSQFISVHCGAIPDTLLESELFGHEKGAFTGAIKRKLGKFEIAQGGTIFLDEIATITPSAQIKLLQVLQDGVFQRVGGEEDIQANVRIIAATNVDLKKLCDEHVFRSDLYYRLNVFPLELPPLRQRKEDIPRLVEFFIDQLNRFHSKEIYAIHPQVTQAFLNYSWPGNIRELENIMERAYILERSTMMMPESFPAELFTVPDSLPRMPMDTNRTLAEARRHAVEEVELCYLKEILDANQGRIKKSAEAAGITSRQLHKLMTKYGLRKEEFKQR
ncbi:MAG: sigma-54 dependent transcriptional regulator [Proteobacteria bacterium]|nr:sigma-54 dependent transcriptional regulator [Pseudomonadota bacterium]